MEDKGDVAFALTNPSNDSKVVIATQFHMLSAAHPNRWAAFIRFGCFVALLFSCGARRLDGLWPGKAPIAPQRREGGPDASAAEPVGAALALAVV